MSTPKIVALAGADPGWQLGPKHHRVIALFILEADDGRQRTACITVQNGKPVLTEALQLHHWHDHRRRDAKAKKKDAK